MNLKPSNLVNYFAPTNSIPDIARMQAIIEKNSGKTLITNEHLVGISAEKLAAIKAIQDATKALPNANPLPIISSDLPNKRVSYLPWIIGGTTAIALILYIYYVKNANKEEASLPKPITNPDTATTKSELDALNYASSARQLTLKDVLDKPEKKA